MSMSGSDLPRARLRLTSETGLSELAVVDSWFRPIEEGTGELDCLLEPGIYEIVARAGPSIERRLIKVAAGEDRPEVAPEVRFPATAPIRGSLAEDDRQLELVRAATRSVAGRVGEAALCVFVRDIAGRPVTPDPQPVELFDSDLRRVAAFASDWRVDGSAAIWVNALEPGGYTLRLGRGAGAIDQSMWLSPGWTAVAFLGASGGVISPTSVSVHVVPIGQEWGGDRDAAATELALWGLREGRWAAGDAAAAVIRAGQSTTPPMQQLAAAHLLLAAPRVPRDLVAEIVGDLAPSMAGHPDLAALQVLLAERGIPAPAPALPVSWPPMLFASYQALLHRDALARDAFKPGSIAERAAATIRRSGIWTTWQPIPAGDRIPPRLARTTVSPERVLAKVARDAGKLRRSKVVDPATRRVAAFLTAVAEVDEDAHRQRIASMSPAEIALATGLPAATVERSLRRIWLTLGGIAVLPFVATVATFAIASPTLALVLLLPNLAPDVRPTPTPTTVAPSVLLPRVDVVSPFDIGRSGVGQPIERELVVSNGGDAPLTVLDLVRSGDAAAEFGIEAQSCIGQTIAPGRDCSVLLTFTPAAPGTRGADLVIHTEQVGEVLVSLSGTGLADLLLDPPEERQMDLGEQRQVFVGANGPVRIERIALGGADPTSFVLDSSNCEGALLDSGSGCFLRVTYKPAGEGAHAAEIVLETDDGRRVSIPVDGIQVIF